MSIYSSHSRPKYFFFAFLSKIRLNSKDYRNVSDYNPGFDRQLRLRRFPWTVEWIPSRTKTISKPWFHTRYSSAVSFKLLPDISATHPF